MATPVTLIGNTPSPYTQKMLALLRYRRIPYSIIWANPAEVLAEKNIVPPRVALLPTFLFDDDTGGQQAMVDSTPIIRRLEQSHAGRFVIPAHPVLAFVDFLLEDFADEWLTKYMFHYRWHGEQDRESAGELLPFCIAPTMDAEQHAWAKTHFSQRQVERLHVVGSNRQTAPIIEASYARFLTIMNQLLQNSPYLLGSRPAASDFAVYGQLSQLVGFDPTPREIAHQLASRVVAWTTLTQDLSGLEPTEEDWLTPEALGGHITPLLKELGRVYVPTMLANAKAMEAGAENWQVQVEGEAWTQSTFPYQGKCLQWVQQQYQNLDIEHRQQVDELMVGTGCEALFGD